MTDVRLEHPLKVPAGVALTPKLQKRYDSGFSPSLTIDEALSYFREECDRFDSDTSITLYTNYEFLAIKQSRRRLSEESAVCCEIRYNRKPYYLLCHQWGVTEQNLYALHLAMRAIHNMVKWGVSDYETVLAGFSADHKSMGHPPPSRDEKELVTKGQWLTILRLDDGASLEQANEAYRHFAKKAAASEEGLLRLNEAISCAREYFGKRKVL